MVESLSGVLELWPRSPRSARRERPFAGQDLTVSAATLVVRRTIEATPEEVFQAWTDPDQLIRWWGPRGVECTFAAVDCRVGGIYRIGNRLPSGDSIWITGEFEKVSPPHELVFTWRIEGLSDPPSRVTVQFNATGASTEVSVTHERIADAATREQHEVGWVGCLEGLSRFLAGRRESAGRA